MKFLNKFLFVAVVSVGLFSCGADAFKGELAASKSEVDSLNAIADSSKSKSPEENDTIASILATYTPLGDGGAIGDHNISVHMDNGYATLSVIKRTSATSVVKVISYNLSQVAVKMSVSVSNALIVEPAPYPSHYTSGRVDTVQISSEYDMKVTKSYPFPGGIGKAFVGAEDPRAGVTDKTGDHYIYAIPTATTRMFIYQKSASTTKLVISTSNSNGYTFINDNPYCRDTVSTIGVKYWGLKFEKSCS